jgi:hypothetical protein
MKWFKAAVLSWTGSQMADLVSTISFLEHRTGLEGNPLVRVILQHSGYPGFVTVKILCALFAPLLILTAPERLRIQLSKMIFYLSFLTWTVALWNIVGQTLLNK